MISQEETLTELSFSLVWKYKSIQIFDNGLQILHNKETTIQEQYLRVINNNKPAVKGRCLVLGNYHPES